MSDRTSEVMTSVGLILAAIEPLPKRLPDGAMVILSGMVEIAMMTGAEAMRRRSGVGDAEIVAWLWETIRPGHKLVAICSGALLAGRAGLLDGYACTTHHACCEELRNWRQMRRCWRIGSTLRMASVIRARG